MAVRRESVLLEVEGTFAEQILADAAAVEFLKSKLNDLNGTTAGSASSTRDLDQATKDATKDTDSLGKSVDGLGSSTQKTTQRTKELSLEQAIAEERSRRLQAAIRQQAKAALDAEQGDKRLSTSLGNLSNDTKKAENASGLLMASLGALSPIISPIAAVSTAAIGGLANDMGMAALAGGSLVLAFHGVGTALQAVDKAAVAPTTANLAAAQQAMDQLAPSAQKFVEQLHSMMPLLSQIQSSSQAAWFPGLTKAIHDLEPLAPVLERIFTDVGSMGGHLAQEGAAALAGPHFADFFNFIDTEAPKAMAAMGKVVGSLADGLSQLWMAFAPLNQGFNDWLVNVAKSFDSWSIGLVGTQGFHDFIAYVQQNGPMVTHAVDAIANAILRIGKAAAPLGGPTLQALTDIADIIAKIAESPLGTPIMLMIQLASVAKLVSAAVDKIGVSFKEMGATSVVASGEAEAATEGIGAKAKVVGPMIAALALQVGAGMSGTANSQNDFNTASASQNLPQMKAALADMEQHLQIWNQIRGTSLSGLGDLFSHPLDALNDTGSDLFGEGSKGLAAKIAAAKVQIKQLEGATGGAATSMKSLRAANQQTADSFVNLAQDMQKPTTSFDKLLSRWQQQAAAEAQLGHNYAKALQEGADPAALAQIKDQLGTGAGLAIKQLADGGTTAIQRLNKTFEQAQKDAQVYNNSLNDLSRQGTTSMQDLAKATGMSAGDSSRAIDGISAAWHALPTKVQTKVGQEGIPQTTSQVDALVKSLDLTTNERKALVYLIDHASPGLKSIHALLASIQSKTVTVTSNIVRNMVTGGHVPGSSGKTPIQHLPGGGSMPGMSADGGTVPRTGMPYADRHPYLLADGEEVISNRYGQADRHRSLLKAINAGHLANGGTAGAAHHHHGPWATYQQLHLWSELGLSVKTLNEHLKDATKTLDKEKQARSTLVSKMQQLSSSVQSGLKTDLFSTAANVWSSQYGSTSYGGVMSTLRGDITHGDQMKAAIAKLRKKGVDGDALAEILSQGGLAGAQEFAGLSRKNLASYERLYNTRGRITTTVGSAAASASYGAQKSEESKQIEKLTGVVKRMEAQIKKDNKAAAHAKAAAAKAHQRGVSSAGRKNAAKGLR
ncbi:MAG: hypothetical protein FWD95_01785 [Nocardioidaceae bacterium]|nr:hypothetical protein [Nocardioidaceae bacterium]